MRQLIGPVNLDAIIDRIDGKDLTIHTVVTHFKCPQL